MACIFVNMCMLDQMRLTNKNATRHSIKNYVLNSHADTSILIKSTSKNYVLYLQVQKVF